MPHMLPPSRSDLLAPRRAARRPEPDTELSPLERFLGGSADPRLSAQQNDEAARQAMIAAGLQMLLSTGTSPSLASGLASGILAGQQVGASGRQQMAQQQIQQQVAQLLTSGQLNTRQGLEQAARQLAAVGAMDEAKLMIDLLKQRPEPAEPSIVRVRVGDRMRFAKTLPDGRVRLLRDKGGGQEVPTSFEAGEPIEVLDEMDRPTLGFQLVERDVEVRSVGGDRLVTLDPSDVETGQPRVTGSISFPDASAQRPEPVGQPDEVFNPATRQDVLAQAYQLPDGRIEFRDINTGEVIPAEPAKNISGDMIARAVQEVPALQQDLQTMDRFIGEEGRAPSFTTQIATGEVLGLSPADIPGVKSALRSTGRGQELEFIDAGKRAIVRIVKIISGSQVSDAERRNIQKVYLPRAGDSPAQVRAKFAALQAFAEAGRQIANSRVPSIPATVLSALEPGSEAYQGVVNAIERGDARLSSDIPAPGQEDLSGNSLLTPEEIEMLRGGEQ